ncbi:sperm flagellar protein 1 isoform X2 [Astyanax mexicanus]|uniref:sperm flagellar protein 1 isoform X2 n=1 Tax=Astyanax mexicanus TaxID=7994 RepID=UPI000BBD845A|nr:sperm flagellar protein 1 isoform X2 [Astyanax mexicanus]
MSTMNRDLDEDALQELYAWIDQINLSRPKRNIARDFSDGVMIAEVVKHFYPKLVDLHNYTPAHSTQQKLSNWNTLNRKVFSKLNFHIPEDTVKKITLSTAGTIEPVLCALRIRLEDKQTGKNLEGTQEPVEYYSTVNEKAQSDTADKGEQVGASGPSKGPAHRGPDKTLGALQITPQQHPMILFREFMIQGHSTITFHHGTKTLRK